MKKKIYLLANIALWSLWINIGCIHKLNGQQDILEVKLIPIENETYTIDHLPVQVVFKNVTANSCRIINTFEKVPICLWFFLTRYDGTPITTRFGGKISFSHSKPPEYIELSPNDTYQLTVDVSNLISKDRYTQSLINQGVYTLSVTYSNQYGKNCFKGRVESEPISVSIHGSKNKR